MIDDTQSAGSEEEFIEEPIIPEEDFREAISACRQDPELNRYFKMAPPGAKLFIGLGFYSTHFGDKVDPAQYAECQAEIEPALTANDLKYLIRFERDKGTKKYLRELLAKREADSAEIVEQPSPPESADVPIALPKRKLRRRAATPNLRADDSGGAAETGVPPLLKVGGAVALLLFIAAAVYFCGRPTLRTQDVRRQSETGFDGRGGSPGNALATEEKRPDAIRAEVAETQTAAPEAAVAEPGAGDDPPQGDNFQGAEPEEPVGAVAADAGPQNSDAGKKPRGRNPPLVVFTDGKKIVRRPGGKIEVPRVFSCAGAGVKPFWVYGAHPEADAAKEMKARAEWQALVRQAEATSDSP